MRCSGLRASAGLNLALQDHTRGAHRRGKDHVQGTTFAVLAGLLAATLVPGGCRDSVSPERRGPLAPQFAAAAAPDVALDQATGLVGTSGTALGQGFSPTNPHNGDAIVATFFWRGSTNIIPSVTDRLADGTPVGNTYTLVEYVQAGGMSMATYVATNVQNFPDPNADWNGQLEVQAHLSAAVTDGGVVLSAYTGVNAVSAAALGAHRSAIGSGSSETTAGPGAISVNAGALVYGVTISNDGVAGLDQPPGFATTIMVSDAEMGAENKSGLKGFAAILSDAAVAALQAQTALVDYIEPDQKGGRPAPRARGPAGGGLPPPVGV